MPVGLFSFSGNRQAQRLQQALELLRPGSVRTFCCSLPETDRYSLDASRSTWNECSLASGEAAFLQGFRYCDPVLPSQDPAADWSVWRFDYLEDQQKFSFLYSYFSELERRGVRVINAPQVHRKLFMKAFVFEHLRQAGFSVPANVCTNSPEAAEEFCKTHAQVVWHPATGRAAWQLCQKAQRETLFATHKPPVLLASITEGPLVRGYLYAGRPLLLLHFTPPRMAPEEQLEEFWEVEYPDLQTEFSRLAQVLGAEWLEVLFVYKDGKAWIYDVDANPLYDCLPQSYQEKITVLLAARLLRLEPAQLNALSGQLARGSRPTMYLRRMLQILFEVEEQKYGP